MRQLGRRARRASAGLVIGFDADDTLWRNEVHYRTAAEKFVSLLSRYTEREQLERVLVETEIRNIGVYGFGFKSYTLSMIEAAVAATHGTVDAEAIQSILQIGREMLGAEVELFQHTQDTLERLAAEYDLMLITKGDLLEQSDKIARSGLDRYFQYVEILQDKTVESYGALLKKHGIAVGQFVMVGNSMKSDILPVLELGGRAVFVPYEHTWAHEQADADGRAYHEIENLGQLPDLLADWEVRSGSA